MGLTMALLIFNRISYYAKRFSELYLEALSKFLGLLVENRLTSRLVLHYFKIVLLFRAICMELTERYTQMELNAIAFLVATVASRLRLSGLLAGFIFFILAFEFHFQTIARFYRKNPTLLAQHFPEGQDPKRRMHRAVQAIAEALSNKVVVATTTAVGGMVAWKGLDVYETHKQGIQQDKQLAAEAIERQKDRNTAKEALVAENQRHQESLAMENQRHR